MPERVGVVVPVRDGARFLGAALDSVLAQEGCVLDVVVVDDGSRDGSAEVARARGVRVVAGPGEGAGPAREAGIAAVRGEWLAFLDADDEWLPGRLRAGLAAFAADPALALCFAHAQNFDAAGPRPPQPGLLPGTLLVRRETYTRVGRQRALRAGELMDWLLRARDLGLCERMLDDVVLRRRIHGGNTTADRERLRDYAHVLKAALDRRRAAEGAPPGEAAGGGGRAAP